MPGISTAFADADAGTLTIFADPDVSAEASRRSGRRGRVRAVPGLGEPAEPLVPVVDLAPTRGDRRRTACPVEALAGPAADEIEASLAERAEPVAAPVEPLRAVPLGAAQSRATPRSRSAA